MSTREKIKRIAPSWALQGYFNAREFLFLRSNQGRHSVFSKIYSGNLWKSAESASGFGSTLDATSEARRGLEDLIEEFGVTSILDVPCGDYNWMRALRFDGHYTGGEIVKELADANQAKFGDDRHRFMRLDLVADTLPKADLVLCRECLNHLSLAEVQSALKNLAPAANKLLVMTQYPAAQHNPDQAASFRYRPLNFTKAPFGLRPPDRLIDETRVETDKHLAIWDMRNGPIFTRS